MVDLSATGILPLHMSKIHLFIVKLQSMLILISYVPHQLTSCHWWVCGGEKNCRNINDNKKNNIQVVKQSF